MAEEKKVIKSESPVTMVKGVPGKRPHAVYSISKTSRGNIKLDISGRDKKPKSINLTKTKGFTSVKQGVSAIKQPKKAGK